MTLKGREKQKKMSNWKEKLALTEELAKKREKMQAEV